MHALRDPSFSREALAEVRAIPALSERERIRILYEWNDTHVARPETCAHRLFEEQVARTPDACAVAFEGVELTYRALDERANDLARRLRARGVGPDVLVGVCLPRSASLVIALLAVWKAGGAYVPLDPTLPVERLAFMLDDASAKVLVTDAAHRALFAPETNAIDVDAASNENDVDVGEFSAPTSSNLAYVMYTSGSTGQPKGVMIEHAGLVNYLLWAKDEYAPTSGGAVPVHSSIAFDLTVTALYVPLIAGGRIEMLREDVGGRALVASLKGARERSLVKITPAHLALLSEELGPDEIARCSKLFVIGGENLVADGLVRWRDLAPETRLINEYGPTETVVGCCVYEVRPDDPRTGAVPIGRPIANTRLYVLDRNMAPVSPGVVGELYIGGAGVARGYLNRPDLTRARFLPDPFVHERGARIYKTGDLARWRVDGTLEYLGRTDDQVKVRGYRIELGEIETTLSDCAGVKACAVIAREDAAGSLQIVAYVVGDVRTDDLRHTLGRTLPEYMVPSHFVRLDALPLTQNGKVDRKALPAPVHESHPPTRPLTPTEEALVAIWNDVLGLDDVGIDDDFFDLGGHSLQAVKTVARIHEAFDVALTAQALFEAPTIERLAAVVDRGDWTPTFACLVPIQTKGSRPPFFLVHAIGGNVYNYRLLSKHLGDDQPFYGIQSRGIRGDDAPHESIEEMARDYVREIRRVQPTGPYRIGGSSSGGVIAYEMAQQLLAIGEEVAVLVMLDTPLPGPAPARIAAALGGSVRRAAIRFDFHVGAFMLRGLRRGTLYLAEVARTRRGAARQIAAAMQSENPHLARVIERNRSAVAAYTPRPYDGPVTMLLSSDEPDRLFCDRRLAWADLTSDGLVVRFMPGDHENMLEEPQVAGVAALVAESLR